MSEAPARFVLDANVFIQAKRRFYPFDVCPGYWRALVWHEASGAAVRVAPAVETLRLVWRTHYERSGGGGSGAGAVRWRAPQEWPPAGERVQSPYDPEMHYSTKRGLEWSGHKAHLTETCDEEGAHLITHVAGRPP